MKTVKYISIFLLACFFGACSVSTLTDETANSFSLTATQGKYNDKVELSWIKIPYYHSYKVYRSESETGLYRPITVNNIDTGVFHDTAIEAGKKYYYKVEGYNISGIPSFTTESAEGFAGINAGLKPPGNLTSNSGLSTTSIKLKWDSVADAVMYQIERRREDEFTFNIIAKVGYTEYEDKDIESGVNYFYQVSSIDKDNLYSADASSLGPVSLYGGDFAVSSSPGVYSDKIELVWTKIPNTKTYDIYRSEKEDSIGAKITTIQASMRSDILRYEDKNVQPNVFYYYTVIYGNDTAAERSFSIRSFLYSEDLPQAVENVTAGQGVDKEGVDLSWNVVAGDNIVYEVSRSISEMGPWKVLSTNAAARYRDTDIPQDYYASFYKITTLKQNGAEYIPSPDSIMLEGWVNRPPINIKASNIFKDRVVLFWDPVPNAESYQISYSLTENGEYTVLDSINPGNMDKVAYEHRYDIGGKPTLDLFYKVRVVLESDSASDWSAPVQGQLNAIGTPRNIQFVNNKDLTKNIGISWDAVPNAKGYAVYIATLDHRGSQFDRLKVSDYKKVGESRNPAYTIAFGSGNNPPLYPIRRHAVMIKAIDVDNEEGSGAVYTDTVYRLPVDAVDFAKDVDFTIIQAQTQIKDFGEAFKDATIIGRVGGRYIYSSQMNTSNDWQNYVSFEVILNGHPRVKPISLSSGSMTGVMDITGLYVGTIAYTNLVAESGIGNVVSGSITATYKNSNGQIIDTDTLTMLGDVDVLQSTYAGAHDKPTYPYYVQGGG